MGTNLLEVLTPLIAYMLLFVRTPSEQQRPFAEIRGAVERLIQEQRAAVRRNNLPTEDYENACFAVVAWLDEMVMGHSQSNPQLFDQWRRSPLQVELYSMANAGEEFFTRLARLTPAQNQITEVYFLALCLGFRGRYYDDAQDYQLVELRQQYSQRLATPVIDLFEIEKRQERVTPEPYGVQPPAHQPIGRRLSPYWLAAPLVGLAALLLYLLWPTPPRQQDVERAVSGFPCAQITAGINGREVNLTGHVESDQQRTDVLQKVQMVKGVKGVTDNLTKIPPPLCEAMEVLGPLQMAAKNDGSNLRVQPQKGCNAAYYKGETMTIDATAKNPLRYVYIDYYNADDNSVVHLYPNNVHSKEPIEQANSITVGSEVLDPVEQPFGLELLTVISSPQPIFSPPRRGLEDAESYVSSLRHILQADAGAPGMGASYCLVTTLDH